MISFVFFYLRKTYNLPEKNVYTQIQIRYFKNENFGRLQQNVGRKKKYSRDRAIKAAIIMNEKIFDEVLNDNETDSNTESSDTESSGIESSNTESSDKESSNTESDSTTDSQ